MSTKTINAFSEAYQISKMFWMANDTHYDRILSSPVNPVKVVNKKVKVPVTKMTDEDYEATMKLLNK